MSELIKKGVNALLEQLGAILDMIIEWLLGKLLAPGVLSNAETGVSIYNGIIGNAINMLTTNPMEWNSDAWQFVENEVYPAFLVVACPLVAIFFLIRLNAESMDPKMHGDVRMDTLLFGMVRLSFAEFITVYALYIVCALFSFTDVLTGGWVGTNALLSTKFNFTTADVEALPGTTLLITWLISVVYLAILIIVACVIAYTATIRFLKILAMIPFGALASSTIAGTREVSSTAMHFWKYMIGVVLEAVVMLLMLALCSRLQGSLQIVSLTGDYRIIGIFLNRILIALLCLGGVKGAEQMLQRIGLGS